MLRHAREMRGLLLCLLVIASVPAHHAHISVLQQSGISASPSSLSEQRACIYSALPSITSRWVRSLHLACQPASTAPDVPRLTGSAAASLATRSCSASKANSTGPRDELVRLLRKCIGASRSTQVRSLSHALSGLHPRCSSCAMASTTAHILARQRPNQDGLSELQAVRLSVPVSSFGLRIQAITRTYARLVRHAASRNHATNQAALAARSATTHGRSCVCCVNRSWASMYGKSIFMCQPRCVINP